MPAQRNGHGRLKIGLGIVLGLAVLLVAAGVFLVAPLVSTELKLQGDLGSRATSVNWRWYNGQSTFSIVLAPGQESQAADIACRIVEPDLASSSFDDADFVIYSYYGVPIADSTTPCP